MIYIVRLLDKSNSDMSADTLTTTSRSFYERAKSKLTISIIISGTKYFFYIF